MPIISITRINAFLLLGATLILGACATPEPKITEPGLTAPLVLPASVPATPVPETSVPGPGPLTPAVVTPAPAPAFAPEQAGDLGYIIEVIPASAKAGFIISQLQVGRDEVLIGDYITFTVGVTNTGEQRGNYAVVLKFNDAIVKKQDVTIEGGLSSTVELTIVPEKCGWYKVTAYQLTTRLGVFY